MKRIKKISILTLAIVFSLVIWACDEIKNLMPDPPTTFTVTFNSQGGSTVSPIIVNSGYTINRPADPTKSGYNFVEWFLNGTSVTFPLTVTQNKVLYAQWQPLTETFTITFDSQGGSAVAPITAEANSIISRRPVNPTKDGYDFIEWTLNGESVTFPLTVTSNKTLVAQWQPLTETFTITFDSQGGSSVTSITINYNTTITRPTNPIKEGYTFVNWFLDNEVFDFNTPITANITLVAQWEAIETFTFTINNGEVTITGLADPNVSELVIPTYIAGLPVTRIGNNAFDGITTLNSVTLNEGLQIIGDQAFQNTSITEITIPSTVTRIGTSAFSGVTTLTNVTLNYGLQTIGWATFAGTSITEITIPSTVISIDNQAFANITILTSVTLNEGLEIIGNQVFWGTSLTEIYMPSSVISIGFEAFDGIRTLTSVTLNEGLQTIGNAAFAWTGITEITIPSTVTSIGMGAFWGTTNLANVTLNEGLQTIGTSAFSGTSITEITIPSTVTSIGSGAFEWITTLTSVTLNEGLQMIGDFAFGGATRLTNIVIPSTVTSIGAWAFGGTSLDEVTLSSGTSVGYNAFPPETIIIGL